MWPLPPAPTIDGRRRRNFWKIHCDFQNSLEGAHDCIVKFKGLCWPFAKLACSAAIFPHWAQVSMNLPVTACQLHLCMANIHSSRSTLCANAKQQAQPEPTGLQRGAQKVERGGHPHLRPRLGKIHGSLWWSFFSRTCISGA